VRIRASGSGISQNNVGGGQQLTISENFIATLALSEDISHSRHNNSGEIIARRK
jgi:hypothetical protein